VQDALEKLKRQGVLEEKDLEAIAVDNKVHALTFDDFYRFDKMVRLKELKKKGLGKNGFISVNKTTSQMFIDLCRLGGVYAY
ncbi:MAG: hypothetical protein ACLS9L_05775, partial [Alphaproteobacteria bacterium]